MKKTLKNLLWLTVVLVMILNLCPVAIIASENIDELSLEMVTGHQPANMITENLTLPAGYTWTSDSSAITVADTANDDGTYTATVNRLADDDQAVTLTASNGTASEEFSLTVKAEATAVFVADTFAYGTDFKPDGNSLFSLESTISGNGTASEGYIGKEGENEYFVNNLLGSIYYKYSPKADAMALASTAEYINLSFKFKFDMTGGSTKQVDLYVYSGTNPNNRIRLINIYDNDGSAAVKSGYNGSSVATLNSDSWNTAEIVLDVLNATVDVKINGTKLSGTDACYSDLCSAEAWKALVLENGLTSISFVRGSNGSPAGLLYLDDFCVWSDNYYNTLTLEKVIGHQPADMITENLTLPAGYTWTSDSSAITVADTANEDGTYTATVNRAADIDTPVTLTASDGDEQESFNLIVKKATATVFVADTFAYGTDFEPDGNSLFSLESTISGSGAASEGYIGKEGENEYFVNNLLGSIYYKYSPKADAMALASTAEYINLSFKFKFDMTDGSAPQADLYVYSGTNPNNRIRLISIYNNNGSAAVKSGYNGSSVATLNSDSWNTAEIGLDVLNATVDVKINGTKLTGTDACYSDLCSAEAWKALVLENGLTSISFVRGSNGSPAGLLYLDDFCVWSEKYPVQISVADGKVNVEYAQANGVLVVAEYEDAAKTVFTDATLYTTFSNVAVPDGYYKIFFFDKTTLAPKAYSYGN